VRLVPIACRAYDRWCGGLVCRKHICRTKLFIEHEALIRERAGLVLRILVAKITSILSIGHFEEQTGVPELMIHPAVKGESCVLMGFLSQA
jgi:hypothetical protein